MDLAEAHRQHLSRWFYDCDYQMHRGLAELYVSDPRYTATYDEIEPPGCCCTRRRAGSGSPTRPGSRGAGRCAAGQADRACGLAALAVLSARDMLLPPS